MSVFKIMTIRKGAAGARERGTSDLAIPDVYRHADKTAESAATWAFQRRTCRAPWRENPGRRVSNSVIFG